MHSRNYDESSKAADVSSDKGLRRRELLKSGISLVGALSVGVGMDAIVASPTLGADLVCLCHQPPRPN